MLTNPSTSQYHGDGLIPIQWVVKEHPPGSTPGTGAMEDSPGFQPAGKGLLERQYASKSVVP